MYSSTIATNPFKPKLSLGGSLPILDHRNSFGTTAFHDSVYVNTLNLALKTELNGLDSCSAFQNSGSARVATHVSNLISNHYQSSKKLKNLIIRNSGIPNLDSNLSGKFSKAVIQITASWPDWIHTPASQSALQRIELKLDNLYDDLLEISPFVDRPILNQLKDSIGKNQESYLFLFEE